MKARPALLALSALATLLGCATARPALLSAAVPQEARDSSKADVRLSAPEEHDYEVPFFAGSTYDPAISAPRALLGFEIGDQPASHAQVLACWRAWASQSKRVKLESYGFTHEGRELVHAVVTSEKNLRELDSILARIGKLADPRTLGEGEGAALCKDTPAVAWLGYSIHGDELSGVDGGLALAHHLVAGTSKDVTDLLERVVVVIDPMQNPDGRERFLSLLLQAAGATAVLDGEALSHGRWPNGRGNHYLFDMNRDWIAGTAPETRGRWKAVQRFHPQLFVDAHEMGRDDSYLFYPQADPINPHLPKQLVEWQSRYAADIAKAFDAHGWSYYTREWADGWGPFYTDSWASLNGAIGILYEQARYDGQTVELESGEIATYRSAAHHQAEASLANLRTLAAAREEALAHYAEFRRAATFGDGTLERPFFVVRQGPHRERFERLLTLLAEQGIEYALASDVELKDTVNSLGGKRESTLAEKDCAVISALQPQGALVRAYLEFDTRYPKADLERERRELELKNSSKIYDTTAWNLGQAFGLECWWAKSVSSSTKAQSVPPPPRPSGVVAAPSEGPIYGWLVDGMDDASVEFAARALQAGLALSISDEPVESAGRRFTRGSLLVRRHENKDDIAAQVERIAKLAGVQAFATTSARAPGEGHDLGGQHFDLLERPRIAMVSNAPVQNTSFGQLWHSLDFELGLPVSLLDAQDLSGYDLRRYNVLVIPAAGGLGALLDDAGEALRAWVDGGGTLIAVGSSAGALARESVGLSSVRRREDVLAKLPEYLFAAQRERAASEIVIDEAWVWDGVRPDSAAPKKEESAEAAKPVVDPDAEREERWRQRFAPQGVMLRAHVREDHWLTVGAGAQLPVFFDGSLSLWARSPAATPVRLAPAAELRLSGLLWPEARERLAESCYATVERRGLGQVILFASQPGFRGFQRSTGRLFQNAVVYGPGVGANPPRLR